MPLVVTSRTVRTAEVRPQSERQTPQARRCGPQPEASRPSQTIRRVNVYRPSNATATARQEAKPEVSVRVIEKPPASAGVRPSTPATDTAKPTSEMSPQRWMLVAAPWIGLGILILYAFGR